jgi:hypothetical protein
MLETLERSSIDLRYQRFRVRNPGREKRLFLSIERNGIQVPLEVIHEKPEKRAILLDGFKRYRIAEKLGIEQLPVSVIGSSEVEGLLRIIRHNDKSSLSGFEEACFIEELHSVYHLSISEIARRVERGVTWVRLRVDMLKNMSETIREKIAGGKFPLRSYLYELGPVTRVRDNGPKVELFVKAVSGHDYSTRDITTLSRAYFGGDEMVQQQIAAGNVDWTLRMLKDKSETRNGGAGDTPQQKFERHLHNCLWHFNRLLPSLQSDVTQVWLSQPSIQEPLERLRSRCETLLKIYN